MVIRLREKKKKRKERNKCPGVGKQSRTRFLEIPLVSKNLHEIATRIRSESKRWRILKNRRVWREEESRRLNASQRRSREREGKRKRAENTL